jgi:mRNA interferase RelE/StbE
VTYSIEFTPAAERQLKALPKPIQTQIVRRIETLHDNPRPDGVKKLKDAEGLYYRVRQGNYRILYTVQDKKLMIIIVKVADRKEVYRRLPRM